MHSDQADKLRKLQTSVFRNANREIPTGTFGILSGKGGVGKSVITLNTGLALGAERKKVLLVDGNFITPSLHVLANVSPAYSVEIWLKNRNLSLAEIVHPLTDTVDLLSPEGMGYSEELKDWQYTGLLRRVLKEAGFYDMVLIDFPTGYFPFMNTVLFELQHIILVTTPDPTSIIDTYAMVKVLKDEIGTKKIKILVNQAENEEDAEISVENLNRAMSHFLSFTMEFYPPILYAEEIRKSVKYQKPIGYENNQKLTAHFASLAYSLQL